MSDDYAVVRVLRQLRVPDRHIRVSLRRELGLDDDQIDRALSDVSHPSAGAEAAVIDLTDTGAESSRSEAAPRRRSPLSRWR